MSDWKPIETAPKDGTDIIVGYVSGAAVWIIRNAWYRDAADIQECIDYQLNDDDESCIGWWSYRNSVTQEMLDGYETPTHWLCETNCPDF